jgi:hypothetical protein
VLFLGHWILLPEIAILPQENSFQWCNPPGKFAVHVTVPLQGIAHRVHFRIQIVKVMQEQGFRKCRHLWRPKFEFSVVADNQMLYQNPQLGRKLGQLGESIAQQPQT